LSEPLFSVSNVAERWGVHRATVLRLFHDGLLPGVVVSRGKRRTLVRFRPATIEAWERRRERESRQDGTLATGAAGALG